MRKVILEIKPNQISHKDEHSPFNYIYSYEVLEVLKMDYEERIFVDVVEFHLREHVCIHDLKTIGNMEILSILKSDGNKYTCLIKGHQFDMNAERYKEIDLNLIYTTPSFISEDKVIISCISTQENLLKFIKLIRSNIGTIKKMTFKKASYEKKEILGILTAKQKQILVTAFSNGYYDLPKKISSEKLSKMLCISKPTLLEHLRKAEKRIFEEIIVGNN